MSKHLMHWAEVEALFDAVIDLDEAARKTVLDLRCDNRPELRTDVEALLASDAQAAALAEADVGRAAETVPNPAPGVGSLIGPFRLVEPIGAGGAGTVYRAHRAEDDFTHQVAIKILDTPPSHAAAARRFRAERQILASLRHPHIVTLLDGGISASGHAYLVMEYVDGVSITGYCTARQSTLADRLEVFRLVCSAVHYAHRHSVVHRDLKPANILVTPEGVPKVLDFGVAKLLDASLGANATATSLGPGPLTPNYASPEQLRGVAVTSSSDVYALGVLLYELMAGHRPYETAGRPLDEVMRLVAETDPPRPSTATESRAPLPYEPARVLKGDLDAIVLRAMAKGPEERYASADELAEDLKRFLTGLPVVARPPSFGYLARKLARRHAAAFVATAVALLVIIAALITALWQARVASAEKQRAEVRFSEVRQLANSLIFEIHDAVVPLPGSTPVRRTLVARALGYLERLANEAEGDPALQLELAGAYTQIGKVQGLPGAANLGDRDAALVSFRRAQALVAPLTLTSAPGVEVVSGFVEATRRLSETLNATDGRHDEAVREAEKAVAVAHAFHRRFPTDVRARNLLASSSFTAAVAIGFPGWLSHWKTVKAIYDELLAGQPENPENLRNVGLVEKYLGTHYEASKGYPEALIHYQRARAMDEKRVALAPTDRAAQLDLAIDWSNEASVRWTQGDSQAAEMFERSLALRQAIASSDPENHFAQTRVAFVHGRLAAVYEQTGMMARALAHGLAALSIYDARSSLDRSDLFAVGQAAWTVARLHSAAGRRPDACHAYGRSFHAFNAVPAADRFQRLGEDPLPELARQAANCGDRAALDWLAAGTKC